MPKTDQEDGYKAIVPGKLSIKGVNLKKEKASKKKSSKKSKKKSKKDKKDKKNKKDQNTLGVSPDAQAEVERLKAQLAMVQAEALDIDHRTETERKFDESRRRRLAESAPAMAAESHRDRVERYNRYLASLSEHHDIPKVGPG